MIQTSGCRSFRRDATYLRQWELTSHHIGGRHVSAGRTGGTRDIYESQLPCTAKQVQRCKREGSLTSHMTHNSVCQI